MSTLDSFEAALLGELRGAVADRHATASRRRLRASAATAAAAVATAAVAAVSLTSSPAFAVQQHPDGDVVVTIDRLSDAAGLERALAEHGVTAHVEYRADLDGPVFDPRKLPPGTPGRVAPAACSNANVPAVHVGQSSVQITLPAATVRTGEPLSIFTAGADPASAKLLVAFGDRDSGCAVFNAADSWVTWSL
jgi:hypothetical protein